MATKTQYEEFFKQADSNHDGSLTLDELVNLLKKKGYSGSDQDLKKYFKSVDTSNDGKISLKEYMIAMGQQKEDVHGEARMRCVFNDFDTNGDGFISESEIEAFFKEIGKSFKPQEIKRMRELMDVHNKDGKVDYEEFIQAVFGKGKK